jgi:hypothetical protein
MWWGAEFNYANTMIHQFKGILQFASPMDHFWLSLHTSFKLAVHPFIETNGPPGGPFVTMLYPHASRGQASVHAPSTWGGVNSSPPYTAPKPEQRGYGGEMVGPLDTETYPGGQEWGVVAERWHRYWSYFERAPELDWDSLDLKYTGRMRAFKWSVWAADTERPVTRILNEVIVAPNPLHPNGFTNLWLEMNVSAPQAAIDRINDPVNPRGPLVGYFKDVAVLHGTSKADVLTLLEQPTVPPRE